MKRIDPITHRIKRRNIRVKYHPPTVTRELFSYQLLDIADSDIQSAKILYLNRQYPQAVFFFQQAVEKLAKAYGMFFNLVKNPLSLKREIGHNPLNIIKKPTNNLIRSLELIKENPFATDLTTGIADINNVDFNGFSKTLIEHKGEINAWLSSYVKEYDCSRWYTHDIFEEIANIFKDLKQAKSELKQQEIATDLWMTNIRNLESGVKNVVWNLSEKYCISNDERDKVLSEIPSSLGFDKIDTSITDIFNDFLVLMVDLMYIGNILVPLSRISSPHEQRSRYPDENEYFTPTEFYTLKNPFIKKLGTFIDYTERTLQLFREAEREWQNMKSRYPAFRPVSNKEKEIQ